jgi:hypothetical protein
MRFAILPAIIVLASSLAHADDPSTTTAASSAPAPLYQTTSGAGSTDWSSYETDTAPGSISAAGMLGISGGAITNVESVKDLSTAINALSSTGTNGGLAIAFTPARSGISPMSQNYYVGPNDRPYILSSLIRLVGSTSLGYAANQTTIGSSKYDQQAISVQASGFFRSIDDPVVGLVDALAKGKYGCSTNDLLVQSPSPPTPKPANTGTDAPLADAATDSAEATNWAKCKANVAKTVPWNPSTYSIGYATGWLKSTSGNAPQYSLGKTLFVGAQVGFLNETSSDPNSTPSSTQGMLLAVAYRRSEDEPIQNTLLTGPVKYSNSNLLYAKLAGGNASIRALIEYNNTRSTNVTQTQLALKVAFGVDAQLAKNVWISLRFGKQNSINGTQTQKASLFNISYSPAALLSN